MREVLGVIQCVVLLMWPMAAFAASESLGGIFTTHKLSDWMALTLLSTVSGLVALLNRIRKNMEVEILEKDGKAFDANDKMILNWRVFAVFHMAGCYMAGFIAFLLGEHLGLDRYLHALTIAGFAWMGAAILDRMADTFSSRALKLLGDAPSKPDGGN